VSILLNDFAAPSPPGGPPTRTAYVAQVDAICQQFVGPENGALSAFIRNSKRWGRVAKSSLRSGNLKPFVKQTRRTAGSLNAFAKIHSDLSDRIRAVPVASGDDGTVASWINSRRHAEASARAAATALNQFKVKVFFKKLHQSDEAELASIDAISDMGFHVCGVSV
jgi:hypothetical protein